MVAMGKELWVGPFPKQQDRIRIRLWVGVVSWAGS